MAIGRPIGQHWTFGQPTSVVAAPATGGAIAGVSFGVLALSLVLLAITSAIVLSLIPLYVKYRDFTPNCNSNRIFTTFNFDGGILPNGQLTSNNLATLQSAFNVWLNGKSGFSHCSLIFNNADVSNCPSSRLKRNVRKDYTEILLSRRRRQSNPNCATQQIQTSSQLNCNCDCVGACLNRRVNQLTSLYSTAIVPLVFPDGNVSGTVVGVDVPITPTTTTSTSTTSTSTSTTIITTTTTENERTTINLNE